jgi:DNA-binding transcriptional ArsR family regulator
MPAPTALEVIEKPDIALSALKGTRRALLNALAEPDSAAGVARRLGLPRQRVNYHLRALERSGLLECIEERRKGNCTERLLRASARAFVISPTALGPLGASPEAAGDRLSAAFAVAVAARTVAEVSGADVRARESSKRIATLTIDAEIRFASAATRASFAEELSAQLASLVTKYHDDAAEGGRRFRLVAMVHPHLDTPTQSTEPTPRATPPNTTSD